MTYFHTGDSVVLLRPIKTGTTFRRQTVVPKGAVGVVVRAPFLGRPTVAFASGCGVQQYAVIDADLDRADTGHVCVHAAGVGAG